MSELLKREHAPLALAALALAAYGAWAFFGGAPKVSLDERVSGPTGYNPWAHWRTTGQGLAFTRWYPARVGENCLPDPLANQDGSLSTGAASGW